MQSKIYHKPGTFEDNPLAGYHSTSLVDGKPFDQVKEDVEKEIEGKLIITVAGENDFRGLDLIMSTYDKSHFDLHRHFKKWNGQFTKFGEKVMQAIGLRSLYLHYHGHDIQKEGHSCSTDAQATMELFKTYIQIKKTNLHSKDHDNFDDEFSNIKTVKSNYLELRKKFNMTKKSFM